ncbi:hypothetical protein F2P81_008328 [Scophthalmus maximus]|uniref:Uncharacterized protein n=1 Tax=Scophthalmus maximus TaxID=52904 RepID=A0A6A4T200_SCOMX|nr:hypothetical protein F2P81_008328 [Scophthalmus maximus]
MTLNSSEIQCRAAASRVWPFDSQTYHAAHFKHGLDLCLQRDEGKAIDDKRRYTFSDVIKIGILKGVLLQCGGTLGGRNDM